MSEGDGMDMEMNLQRYPDAPRGMDTVEAGNTFEDYATDRIAESGIVLRTYKSAGMQLRIGESKAGFEFKLDNGHRKYNHLSIEVAERRQASGIWVLSGIFRNDNAWLYIQGDTSLFWVLFKPSLVKYAHILNILPLFVIGISVKPPIYEYNGTVRKFYLPPSEADLLGKRYQKGA